MPQKKLKANQGFLPVPIFGAASVQYSKKSESNDVRGMRLNPMVAFAGGGGSANSGIKNSIVRILCSFYSFLTLIP